MTTLFKSTMWWITFLTGLLLIFIGVRFFMLPETAEVAFGINLQTNGDFSFHYIKGVRDIFSGALIAALLLLKEYRSLGIALLLATLIPSVDLWVVVSHPHYEAAKVYPHLTAVILCIGLGVWFLKEARHYSAFNMQLSPPK